MPRNEYLLSGADYARSCEARQRIQTKSYVLFSACAFHCATGPINMMWFGLLGSGVNLPSRSIAPVANHGILAQHAARRPSSRGGGVSVRLLPLLCLLLGPSERSTSGADHFFTAYTSRPCSRRCSVLSVVVRQIVHAAIDAESPSGPVLASFAHVPHFDSSIIGPGRGVVSILRQARRMRRVRLHIPARRICLHSRHPASPGADHVGPSPIPRQLWHKRLVPRVVTPPKASTPSGWPRRLRPSQVLVHRLSRAKVPEDRHDPSSAHALRANEACGAALKRGPAACKRPSASRDIFSPDLLDDGVLERFHPPNGERKGGAPPPRRHRHRARTAARVDRPAAR